METKIVSLLLSTLLAALQLHLAMGVTVVRGGYWFPGSGFAASSIESTLFTHLLCAFANLDPQTYQVNISSSNQFQFSSFTRTVQQKNPSLKTLLSIGGGSANAIDFALMASQNTSRKSFIDSSINLARSYNFHGLDLDWQYPSDGTQMTNLGMLLTEWRAAVAAEAKSSGEEPLLLSSAVHYLSYYYEVSVRYPIQAISNSLDWINLMANDFYGPGWSNSTGPPAALYNPGNQESADNGVQSWIQSGLSSKKIVLGIPFFGWSWHLKNANNHGLFSPAAGAANLSENGSLAYSQIKRYIKQTGATKVFNATVVGDYCYSETTWIGHDDNQSISTKISYAEGKELLGYYAWHVGADDNWTLSTIAFSYRYQHKQQQKWKLIVIILAATILVIFLSSVMLNYMRMRRKKARVLGLANAKLRVDKVAVGGHYNSSDTNILAYRLSTIKAATDNFSPEMKLGQGGYGPVYKGVLQGGQEIAVKKLSKTSKQGLPEFENKVTLTARLQHVNLVKLLGFCVDGEEHMLIYEYMPNKSLDYYLFDPIRRVTLNWEKRVGIIEGITQGLLYLQEYSRVTIIHRDLKASNILLDANMKPKISDFGMAKIFASDKPMENTGRIVGTPGYVPPEYVSFGVFSTKLDVYSFGILLLQIINGKKNCDSHGLIGTSSLTQTAYELWIVGKGKDILDPTLDDSSSSCKLMKCLQIALLCVQENADDRPSMLEVSTMLVRNETADIAVPKRPAFSSKTNGSNDKTATRVETCSVDDATITIVEGR